MYWVCRDVRIPLIESGIDHHKVMDMLQVITNPGFCQVWVHRADYQITWGSIRQLSSNKASKEKLAITPSDLNLFVKQSVHIQRGYRDVSTGLTSLSRIKRSCRLVNAKNSWAALPSANETLAWRSLGRRKTSTSAPPRITETTSRWVARSGRPFRSRVRFSVDGCCRSCLGCVLPTNNPSSFSSLGNDVTSFSRLDWRPLLLKARWILPAPFWGQPLLVAVFLLLGSFEIWCRGWRGKFLMSTAALLSRVHSSDSPCSSKFPGPLIKV